MTKYVSLLQLKGGAGKSTVAINLIGYLLSKNKRVLGADADMQQGTLFAWSNSYSHKNYQFVGVRTLDELIEKLKEADGNFDFVVIDLPPRLEDMARSSLVLSDLILLPISLSAPDIWAAADMKPLISEATAQKDINLKIVWNKFKNTKRKLELKDQVKELMGFDEVKTPITDYVAYSDVVGYGTWVGEFNHPKAKEEFNKFGNEIAKLLK